MKSMRIGYGTGRIARTAMAVLTAAALAVWTLPVCAAESRLASFQAVRETDFVWNAYASLDAAWWQSDEAAELAGEIMRHQMRDGGWRKNMWKNEGGVWRLSTLDNGATWGQIRFLARFARETGREDARDACRRGVEFLLGSQHPCGGWAQIPAAKGVFSAHITYNDGVTTEALRVLKLAAERSEPEGFAWVDGALAERAREALELGLDWILKSQIRIGGRLTGWCQQYDEVTLLPAKARAYEMPAVSAWESAGVVQYLMDLNSDDPAVVQSIEAALRWFEETKITGMRFERVGNDRLLLPGADDDAIWARFYDLESGRPVFGDRNGKVYDDVMKISLERRTGYDWYGTWPASVLNRARDAAGK